MDLFKNLAVICELSGTSRQGGEQLAMLRMAESLQNKSNKINVYSYSSSNKNYRIETIIPFKLRLFPYIRDIFVVPFIGKKILKNLEKKYSAIIASSTTISSFYKPSTTFILICHIIRSQRFEKLSKFPIYGIFFNSLTYKIISYLENKSLKNADRIIVLRQRQKDFLIQKLGIDENNITIIPNGIDTNIFKPLKVKKKKQIIFVGRGTVGKGIDTLINASDSIKAKILIVTHRIDNKYLEEAKTKPNIKFIFNANAQKLASLYSESALFVLPSRDEEQPLSTLEAMACGLPVIVTTEGGSDIVKDGINGFIVSESDSVQLANKANRLLSDKKTLSKMSFTNREYIKKNYSLDKITNRINKFIYV